MDGLIAWVRGFLYLLFFATLVQVILPDDGIRRYTRLVVGLIVLAALLQPVTDLVRNPAMLGDSLEGFFSDNQGAAAADAWIAEGERMRELGEDRAIRQFAARTGEQIEGMLSLVQGVESAEVVDLKISAEGVARAEVRLVGTPVVAGEVESVLHKFFGIPVEAVALVWDAPGGG